MNLFINHVVIHKRDTEHDCFFDGMGNFSAYYPLIQRANTKYQDFYIYRRDSIWVDFSFPFTNLCWQTSHTQNIQQFHFKRIVYVVSHRPLSPCLFSNHWIMELESVSGKNTVPVTISWLRKTEVINQNYQVWLVNMLWTLRIRIIGSCHYHLEKWKNNFVLWFSPWRRQRMLSSEFLPRAHLPARHVTHPGLLPPRLVSYDYAYDHRATSIPPPSYQSESHNRATRYGYGSGQSAIDNGLPPPMRFAENEPVDDYNHGPGPMTAIGSALYHTRPSVTRSKVLYNPLARMASESKSHLVYFWAQTKVTKEEGCIPG